LGRFSTGLQQKSKIFQEKMIQPSINSILPEIDFATSRSSGPGGQNVNKVNTKVTLLWGVNRSSAISLEQREIILLKLASIITKDGVLQITSQEKRSQLQNKEVVIQKLEKLLAKAFTKKKARKATKPSKAATQKRIQQKKLRGEKKKWRRGEE
jgi:ribosome-associated protein